jgi:hypothetical protein
VKQYDSIDDMFRDMVPRYKSKSWRMLTVKFKWDRTVAAHMEKISSTRCAKRRNTYLIPGELQRATESIRFGHEKTGHGYHGKRGDFCLIGGRSKNGHLTVFYRRLEMIGGLHYDLAIFREVEKVMGTIRSVTIIALEACVFARRGNSGEKLFAQLNEFYAGRPTAPPCRCPPSNPMAR